MVFPHFLFLFFSLYFPRLKKKRLKPFSFVLSLPLVSSQIDYNSVGSGKSKENTAKREPLIETVGRTHGALDVDRADVLPVLLEQRNEKVDGELDVLGELTFSETNVADGNTETEYLFHLELDGGLDLGDLLGNGLIVGDKGGKFSSLVQSRTKKTRNLTKDSVRGNKGVVLGSCWKRRSEVKINGKSQEKRSNKTGGKDQKSCISSQQNEVQKRCQK